MSAMSDGMSEREKFEVQIRFARKWNRMHSKPFVMDVDDIKKRWLATFKTKRK